MLKKDLEKFKRIKKELLKEGFIIEGVVGSFARGENYNDIDIVYSVNKDFLAKYGGFGSVIRINEIKETTNKMEEKEVKKEKEKEEKEGEKKENEETKKEKVGFFDRFKITKIY